LVRPRGTYDAFHRFVDPAGYRLSDRVWRTAIEVRSRVDELMEYHVASGTAAVDIARSLESFMTPSAAPVKTRTPYGREGSYSARRLARTEITAAAGRATTAASAANPFVGGVQWRLSGSHRDLDECDFNASGGPNGDGIYPPDEVPRYPNHPHEMCTLVPVPTKSVADLVEQLRADIQAAQGSLISAVGGADAARGTRLQGILSPEYMTKALLDGTLDTSISEAVRKSAEKTAAEKRDEHRIAVAKSRARTREREAEVVRLAAEEATRLEAEKKAAAEAEAARIELEREARLEAERRIAAERAAEERRLAEAEAKRLAEEAVARKAAEEEAAREALRKSHEAEIAKRAAELAARAAAELAAKEAKRLEDERKAAEEREAARIKHRDAVRASRERSRLAKEAEKAAIDTDTVRLEAERVAAEKVAAEAKKVADEKAAEAARIATEAAIARTAARLEAERLFKEAEFARMVAEAEEIAKKRAILEAKYAAEAAAVKAAAEAEAKRLAAEAKRAADETAKKEAARIKHAEATKAGMAKAKAAKEAAAMAAAGVTTPPGFTTTVTAAAPGTTAAKAPVHAPPAKVLRPAADIKAEIAAVDTEVERIRAKRLRGEVDTTSEAEFMRTRRKDRLDPLWAAHKASVDEDAAIAAWKPPAVGTPVAPTKAYRAVLSLESEIASIEAEVGRLSRKSMRGGTFTPAEDALWSGSSSRISTLRDEMRRSADEDKRLGATLKPVKPGAVAGVIKPPDILDAEVRMATLRGEIAKLDEAAARGLRIDFKRYEVVSIELDALDNKISTWEDAHPEPVGTGHKLKYRPPKAKVEDLANRVKDDLSRSGVVPERVLGAVKEIVDTHPVRIFAPDKIVDFWQRGEERFKSQFETHTTMGAKDLSLRSRAENRGLGIPSKVADVERPVYGYVDIPGNSASHYGGSMGGGLRFTIKDSVRERMTFTMGDSLFPMDSSAIMGTPMTAPGYEGIGTGWTQHSAVTYAKSKRAESDQRDFMSGVSYIEWQVQGTLPLSDISEVNDAGRVLSSDKIKWFQDRGIKVTFDKVK
jgi:hypothetical protein